MSQDDPLSDHLSSLTLNPTNTISKESDPGSCTENPSVMEYASEEENAQFHKEFPNVPQEERLLVYIDRWKPLYVSEKHVYCRQFNEKSLISMDDMIAVYIQWGITKNLIFKFQLITRHTTLDIILGEATDLSSNAIYRAFDIIRSRWNTCLHRAGDVGLENTTSKQTMCMCSKEGNHGPIYLEGVFLGTPQEIHHLLFMSEVGKNYWCTEMQKKDYQN
ncbi:hypothetical protein L218DRAFT_668755 [Marasmius fiardii PR-910]|nr:hypothetical protein L218DRAFT_668755 [Marasmius fiardii PR-910]